MRVKGQALAGPLMGIFVAAIILLIGMVAYAQVFQTTGNAPYTENSCNAVANCSYTVVHPPAVISTVSVINCTVGETLTRGTDYLFYDHNGTFQVINGDLNTSCSLPITYRTERIESDTTSELINDTASSAVEIVTVGLIILAAIILLGAVFLLGRRA